MSLTQEQISEIRQRALSGERGRDLAEEFGVSPAYISAIKHNRKGVKQVWLTLDEAKWLLDTTNAVLCLSRQRHLNEFLTQYLNELFVGILQKRIAEAEGKNEAKRERN